MTGNAKRHNLADWLALHDLDQALCGQILNAAARQVSGQLADQEEPASEWRACDPDVAWLSVVDAMCAFFPTERSFIERIFKNTSKVRVASRKRVQRALTLNNRNNGYPTIVYTYCGNASDFLVVAHEFAHALQIVASGGKFVAPIVREICAFIGEMALLSFSCGADVVQYSKFQQVWHRDNRKYLLSDGEKLRLALCDLDADYRYYWNYPIARHLAIGIFKEGAKERMWTLFEGNLSVRNILQDVRL